MWSFYSFSLSLSNVVLGGSIPSTIGLLTWLKSITLRNLELVGSIPPTIGSLSVLNHIDLEDNALTGTLPSSLSNMSSLTYLSAANNSLYGSLPSNIDSMKSLTTLLLNSNSLAGNIPSSVCQLNLKTISFLENKFLCVPLCILKFGNMSYGTVPFCHQSKSYSSYFVVVMMTDSISSMSRIYVVWLNEFYYIERDRVEQLFIESDEWMPVDGSTVRYEWCCYWLIVG